MFKKPEQLLRLVLIASGASCAMAVLPMLMPLHWLATCHRLLGLGPMPSGPLVEYLIRSVCGLYAMLGVLMIMTGQRLPQYRPMVMCLAGLWIGFGLAIGWIDLSAGLPSWWTWSESLMTIAMGATFYVLGRKLPTGPAQ
jgi:hypothetical protein